MDHSPSLRQRLDRFRAWAVANHRDIQSDNSSKRAEYLRRVQDLHAQLCESAGLSWALHDFQPLVTDGRAAYYYGTVSHAGEMNFLKVRPAQPGPHAILNALAEDQLPAQGKYYSCLAPRSAILLDDIAGVYAFPFWSRLPGPMKGGYANPLVQKGLAEFNLCLTDQPEVRSLAIRRIPLKLRNLEARHFEGFSVSEQASGEYLAAHEKILDLWEANQARLNALPQGLLHGDLGLTNFREHAGRLFLIDVEDAGIGPLGGDLAWMLFYAERISNEQERQRYTDDIFDRYTASCQEMGVEVSKDDACLAAQALYFLKWLFPGPGTQSNIEALARRQRAALRLLG